MQLTLRTLLAYLDDTLSAKKARDIGRKIGETPKAEELIDRIRKVLRRRRLTAPPAEPSAATIDANDIAGYLDNDITHDAKLADIERICLESDTNLAEVAAVHQILSIVLVSPVEVEDDFRRRLYRLHSGRLPTGRHLKPIGATPAPPRPAPTVEESQPLPLSIPPHAAANTPAGRFALILAMTALTAVLVVVGSRSLQPAATPAEDEPTVVADRTADDPAPALDAPADDPAPVRFDDPTDPQGADADTLPLLPTMDGSGAAGVVETTPAAPEPAGGPWRSAEAQGKAFVTDGNAVLPLSGEVAADARVGVPQGSSVVLDGGVAKVRVRPDTSLVVSPSEPAADVDLSLGGVEIELTDRPFAVQSPLGGMLLRADGAATVRVALGRDPDSGRPTLAVTHAAGVPVAISGEVGEGRVRGGDPQAAGWRAIRTGDGIETAATGRVAAPTPTDVPASVRAAIEEQLTRTPDADQAFRELLYHGDPSVRRAALNGLSVTRRLEDLVGQLREDRTADIRVASATELIRWLPAAQDDVRRYAERLYGPATAERLLVLLRSRSGVAEDRASSQSLIDDLTSTELAVRSLAIDQLRRRASQPPEYDATMVPKLESQVKKWQRWLDGGEK